MKFKMFFLICFFSFIHTTYAAPDNLCREKELTGALFGICNAYINVDCRDKAKHETSQCIALRKNFESKSNGQSIDEILAISNEKNIIINAFYDDLDTPAEAGALVFINGENIGSLNSEGSYQVSLLINETYLIRIVELGLVAGQSSIVIEQQMDENYNLNIVMKGESSLFEEATLKSDDINNQILNKDFQTLMFSFVNSKGETVKITEMGDIEVFLEKNDDDKVYVENLFSADSDGNIVLQDVNGLKDILLSFATGKIIFRISAAENNSGLLFGGSMEFYLGAFELSGVLASPPSNQTLAIEGVEINAIFLGGENELILNTISDVNGEFNFPILPAGNWSIKASTMEGNIGYSSSAEFNLNGNKLVTLNLLSLEDIINDVPFFEIQILFASELSQISIFNPELEISKNERKQILTASIISSLQQSNTANISTVSVTSSTKDNVITDKETLLVPQNTKTVTLSYEVFTQEYPTYVLQQSVFNDQWKVAVFASNGDIFNIVRQVNSQLFISPIWLSNGTTGEITEELDVSSLTIDGDITLVLYASSVNIGDSALATTVNASLKPGAGLKIKEIIRDTVSNTKGDSSYFSIPRLANSNTFQRAYTLKINKPDGAIIKNVKADILNNNQVLQTIVDEAPSPGPGGLVQEIDDETLQIIITIDSSTINSTPPVGHNIIYRFKVEAELDGEQLDDEKDSDQNKALWKLPNSIARVGSRDQGGDGWAAKGTYEWLNTNSNSIAEVNDISGEHARNIGHSTHFKGTDIDTYHFVNLLSGNLNGTQNYNKLKSAAISALNNNATALQTVTSWIDVHRNELDTLTGLSTVAEVITPKGTGTNTLPSGWVKQLMTTGKVVNNSNTIINTNLGLWSNSNVRYRNDHNNHLHIDLKDSQLNNTP